MPAPIAAIRDPRNARTCRSSEQTCRCEGAADEHILGSGQPLGLLLGWPFQSESVPTWCLDHEAPIPPSGCRVVLLHLEVNARGAAQFGGSINICNTNLPGKDAGWVVPFSRGLNPKIQRVRLVARTVGITLGQPACLSRSASGRHGGGPPASDRSPGGRHRLPEAPAEQADLRGATPRGARWQLCRQSRY
jgi:hypothetical protein